MVQALQCSAHSEADEPLETMRSLSSKYCYQDEGANPLGKGSVILLTGTTGNLGCYLLRILGEHPCVQKLICLVRAAPDIQPEEFEKHALARQKNEFVNRGILLTVNAWVKIRFQRWYVQSGSVHASLFLISKFKKSTGSRASAISFGLFQPISIQESHADSLLFYQGDWSRASRHDTRML